MIVPSPPSPGAANISTVRHALKRRYQLRGKRFGGLFANWPISRLRLPRNVLIRYPMTQVMRITSAGFGAMRRGGKTLFASQMQWALKFAYANKRAMKDSSTPISEAAHQFVQSRFAVRFLDLTAATNKRDLPIIGPAMSGLLRVGLITISNIHMAAGNHQRSIHTARLMNVLLRPEIRARDGAAVEAFVNSYWRARLYPTIIKEFPRYEPLRSMQLLHCVTLSHIFCGSSRPAVDFSRSMVAKENRNHHALRAAGTASFMNGDALAAAGYFERSVAAYPKSVMAHHNYAARNVESDYVPAAWELRQAGTLVPYDALNVAAEEAFLSGDALGSMALYKRALDHQEAIGRGFSLPDDVLKEIASAFPRFDPALPVRILPNEWVTQFGHIGLLDSYLKIQRLGWRPVANNILLAPPDKVVIPEYLDLWKDQLLVVRDSDLCNRLFPFIRALGENFMAASSPGPFAEPWTRLAARAQIGWAKTGQPALITLDRTRGAMEASIFNDLGLPKDAWYVGLHVREGGYYGESSGSISTHRNAMTADYLPALEEITKRGGYVIRLGDKTMTPIPKMDRVIDYALSPFKSPSMDLFLLATSRFVIGTTSGLTTAALTLGTPMVLVNCISNDWQIWTEQADFIVKKLFDKRRNAYVSLADTYRQPLQGTLINNVLVNLRGYEIHANTAAEIREAVAYKARKVIDGAAPTAEEKGLVDAFDRAMAANPFNFGAARPVPQFLAANPWLLAPAQQPDISPNWSLNVAPANAVGRTSAPPMAIVRRS